jgi:hypothetical protein
LTCPLTGSKGIIKCLVHSFCPIRDARLANGSNEWLAHKEIPEECPLPPRLVQFLPQVA